MLACAAALAPALSRPPYLLVVPLSTVAAWSRELRKWAPALDVVTYTGPAASRCGALVYVFS
eukprot:8176922-Pyramimonas_sp.AAC.1